nr:PB1 domain, AUX/IAA protein, auxin response factor, DNA-binding pseudobarrel domain protein [Tanacetum cinerariifolium]
MNFSSGERVSLWEIETYSSPVSTSLVQQMTPKNKKPQSAANNPIIGRKIAAADDLLNFRILAHMRRYGVTSR